MPPVNTPAVASPSRSTPVSSDTASHSRPPAQIPDPLSYLSSPAPDLASTLYTQAADAVDEENADFLRDSLESLDQAASTLPLSTLQPEATAASRRSEIVDGPDTTAHRYPRRGNLHPSGSLESQESRAFNNRLDSLEEDLTRRERLHRVLARLNRLHEPNAATANTTAYSNRTPSPNRQSLYDWAPAYDINQETSELDTILNELRRQQPSTHNEAANQSMQNSHNAQARRQRDREGSGTPIPADSTNESSTDRRERLGLERERLRRENDWISLRTRAAVQRSRQGSPSATDRMLRYVMERERSGVSEEEERARVSGWFTAIANSRSSNAEPRARPNRNENRIDPESWLLPPPASTIRDQDRQERVDAFRRGYLAENVPPRLPRISTPPVAPPTNTHGSSSLAFLRSALKYLDDLRKCVCYEDALAVAIDHGLATKEFFADKHDDFVMDLGELPGFAETSWLQPGSIFEGHQHATSSYAGLAHIQNGASGHVVEQINPNYRRPSVTPFLDTADSTRPAPPFDAARPWLSHRFMLDGHFSALSKRLDPTHDHWPVRVVIHALDQATMTLQGTMEAYDVPQQPTNLTDGERPKAGKKHDPITTYVEGHIIDGSTHSFLTPRQHPADKHAQGQNSRAHAHLSDNIVFPSASSSTDAANWRKLPPFDHLPSDDEAARVLLSRARMSEIHEQYVFMRWKERCFVHSKDDKCDEKDRNGDQDRGHGLTISGFYYISLRRSDGLIEGLYFDPTSTPYQHLRLQGKGMGWPAFALR